MLEYMTIEKFAAESGHTEAAIRKKFDRGEWLEGEVWVKRGGRIYIILEGFYRWVEKGLESAPPRKARSKSISATAASGAANASI